MKSVLTWHDLPDKAWRDVMLRDMTWQNLTRHDISWRRMKWPDVSLLKTRRGVTTVRDATRHNTTYRRVTDDVTWHALNHFMTWYDIASFVLFFVGKCRKRTTSRYCCAFPFRYKGRRYNSCTSKNHKRPWCAITHNYDRDRKWGNCAGKL